jgi:hypothetical protein
LKDGGWDALLGAMRQKAKELESVKLQNAKQAGTKK